MYYEVNHSEKIKNAKDKIENYSRRRYINLDAIDFQENRIVVCIEDHNNPYIMNYNLTKSMAITIENETELKIMDYNENGFILE